ncbi:hypothetical protein SB659_18145 [Arthrobacter sp. SIMBA_036]|uniref:hypothetical protein n=1 Tax=Arthrobacter sp. SIMBA_036 TaxID=3085778 RepID=UPI00397E3AD2
MKLQSRSCVHLRRSGRTQLITMTQHGEQILERVISAEHEALFGVLLEGRFREELEVLVRTLSEHDAAEH